MHEVRRPIGYVNLEDLNLGFRSIVQNNYGVDIIQSQPLFGRKAEIDLTAPALSDELLADKMDIIVNQVLDWLKENGHTEAVLYFETRWRGWDVEVHCWAFPKP